MGFHFCGCTFVTSIDLALSSGKEIVIEERSPKELLNSRGDLLSLVEPAVTGTLNVLKACSEAKVKSSACIVCGYKSEAVKYPNTTGLDVATVCPYLVLCPMLRSTANASSFVLINMLKEGLDSMENKIWKVVDVRDVANALLLTCEKPEAKGRFLCLAYITRARDMVEKYIS
ncbi:hypothetical protein IFM89_006245 [Coptis chinensis]|uniref:Uncharacterized protein n=1 Tax=Coptis chinensis TaxID=261450 RepID=A0A835IUH3_9MAGN|nr:hypothetical protein IFM89_006245 [Coptis chinensis]